MASTQAALEFVIRANDDDLRASISRMEADFRRGVQGMAIAANDQARRIDQALSGIQGFRDLKRQIGETESQWQAATREVARLARELREKENPTRAMAREFERAKRNAGGLKSQSG